ncbi:AAA domain-containing protein [candidate division KSB1 bacterium]|nr:AAA domain-containing protein [candidate division KSB1 bacterium]NIT70193.1 AAA domain-containing protein [candidate division KSB1 bacterium]NIX69874.1 AAA domain-containing protein [candidate division KSB1 bacterium]
MQGRKGFMWFATEDGLNRYDGYQFKIYKHEPGNANSLSDSFIRSIYEDRDGVLWIGTNGLGLNRFEPQSERVIHYSTVHEDPHSLSANDIQTIYEDQTGTLWVGTNGGGLNKLVSRQMQGSVPTFVRYQHNQNDPYSLSNNNVQAVFQDREGVLWIGTASGLNRFDPTSGRFFHYLPDPKNPYSLSSYDVRAICQDHQGELWIGTDTGLNRLVQSPESEQAPSDIGSSPPIFFRYLHDPNDPSSLSNNNIRSLYEDGDGVLWIGTAGGLNKLDRKREQFISYRHDPDDPQSLSSDAIRSIYQDRSGVIWIGTYGAGLNKFDPRKQKLILYQTDPDDPSSLSDNEIFKICEDREGMLWIGTYGGGLNRLDPNTKRFTRYQHDPDDANSLSDNHVWAICVDRDEVLWIGTECGLERFDPQTNPETARFVHYQHDPDDPNSLSHNQIWTIYQDREGILWIGTEAGLDRLVLSDKQGAPATFVHYQHDPDDPYSISSHAVMSIYQDREGTLWIGTFNGGLNTFDRQSEQFLHYHHDPNDPQSLSNNAVLSIYEDETGTLWIGTYGGGLNRLDRETGTFTYYKEKDGLPNNVVYGILEDDRGNFWISTNNGLSRFDPRTETFKNYDVNDGLQSNEFNLGAYHKTGEGEMFFGGINGLNAFYPEDIKDNPFVPPVVITDFQLFNESVPIGEDSLGRTILNKVPSETKKIELSYKDAVFSFEFAALDYSNPEKNQYKYIMEGFDKDWIDTDARKRFVTYTNLDPGEYIFRFKGSNSDGVWNEEGAAIKIIIRPPLWQKWWFRSLLAFGVLLSAFGLYKRRIHRIEAHKRELETQVEERTKAAEALQNALAEVERLKNRLQAENIYLQDEIKLVHNFENIITHSEALKQVLRNVEQVASTDATVLILGETGTGKELLARAVHNISPRGERPLVKVNCSALPTHLIESELFGHEKGAFTGAIAQKIGRFELANGGTIFLDEIGDLPLELQAKLLRVLQDGEFERVGNPKTIKVDVRVIAATNRNLEKEVENGDFREDLYYRLNVFPIKLPPLRERKEDIPLLVNHFIKKYSKKIGKRIETIPQDVLDILQKYRWPGNVRELENIIERAVITSPGKNLVLGDWFPTNSTSQLTTELCTLEECERRHIINALEFTGWRVSGEKGAAKLLGLNAKTLESRMKKLHIERKK